MNYKRLAILGVGIILPVLICIKLVSFLFLSQNPPSVNKDVLQYLQPLQKGIVTSTVLSLKSKNKITRLDTKGGIIKDINVPYVTLMQITLWGNKTEDIYFTNNTLSHTTILIPNGTNYKKGSFSDLHTGDMILLERDMSFNLKGGRSAPRTPSIKFIKITKMSN
jgi:hypothetical protein